jgi:hypothetical protein
MSGLAVVSLSGTIPAFMSQFAFGAPATNPASATTTSWSSSNFPAGTTG